MCDKNSNNPQGQNNKSDGGTSGAVPGGCGSGGNNPKLITRDHPIYTTLANVKEQIRIFSEREVRKDTNKDCKQEKSKGKPSRSTNHKDHGEFAIVIKKKAEAVCDEEGNKAAGLGSGSKKSHILSELGDTIISIEGPHISSICQVFDKVDANVECRRVSFSNGKSMIVNITRNTTGVGPTETVKINFGKHEPTEEDEDEDDDSDSDDDDDDDDECGKSGRRTTTKRPRKTRSRDTNKKRTSQKKDCPPRRSSRVRGRKSCK